MPRGPQRIRQAGRWFLRRLWPNHRLRWTREGIIYGVVWACLLATGLVQQINLILLIAGLAAGPMVGSFWSSATMLRRLRIARRVPAYAFSGEPLQVDYTLENDRPRVAALALILSDQMVPVDRSISGGTGLYPRGFFPRVPGRSRARVRWEAMAPRRGRYRFRSFDLVTRSPFGLLERRVLGGEPATITIYPAVGHLTRRWQHIHREASETRRGSRHDRSLQQQEYHGLRDYRPGDSPRWVHWRTSARIGKLMVKEFEQQHEQDLALLIDPWLPAQRASAVQREAVEQAIRFAATVCLDTCRHTGRRFLLGWTGPNPGLRQGPASVKLLHEMLEQLATLRASADGSLATLLDAVPPSTLRESALIVVSTRHLNLQAEADKSTRLPSSAIRGFLARVTSIDVSKGELDELFQVRKPSVARGDGTAAPVAARLIDHFGAPVDATGPGQPASTKGASPP